MLFKVPYILSALIFMFGMFIILTKSDFFSKLLGLSILQVGVLVFYIAIAKAKDAAPPLDLGVKNIIYSSPLNHVLILTGIVVGFATISVGVALLLKIYKNYGTLDENDIIS